MDANIREVKTKKELRAFIFPREKVHANHENWVHAVYMDE
jgi:hypothetical protein